MNETTDRVRVEIVGGAWAGYTGRAVDADEAGDRVRVRLDHSGGYHWFATDCLRPIVD